MAAGRRWPGRAPRASAAGSDEPRHEPSRRRARAIWNGISRGGPAKPASVAAPRAGAPVADPEPASAAALDPVAGGDLDPAALVGGRVLHERDQPAGHEPAGPDRRAGARDLADLDDAARRHDLDPPPGLGGDDLERLDALAGVDHGLDAITLHAPTVDPGEAPGKPHATAASAGDLGPLREERRDRKRPDQPGHDHEEGDLGLEPRDEPAAVAATEAAGRADDGAGRVERHELHDVRQEDPGEVLAEVERDAGPDPGQLAPGERRDRETEGALLDHRQPAPPEQSREACRGSPSRPGRPSRHRRCWPRSPPRPPRRRTRPAARCRP